MDIVSAAITLMHGNILQRLQSHLTQLNIIPTGNQSDRHGEHVDESQRFVHFSCIPTVHRLVDVALQMLVADVMVAANNHPAEMRPKALNAVREYVPIGIFIRSVVHYGMVIAHITQAVVGIQLVGNDPCALLDVLAYNRHQRSLVGLLYGKGTDIGHGLQVTMPVDDERAFHNAEHGSLGLCRATLRVRCAHGLVFPLLLAADIDLVALHLTLEHSAANLLVQQSYFLQHIPCRGLCDMDVTAQLMGRYALLVAADEVHRHEPLDERHLGVLEYRTDEAREVLEAMATTETPVASLGAMALAAIGADDVTVGPTRFDNGLLASFFSIEIGCE